MSVDLQRLRIGALAVDRAQAWKWAEEYLSGVGGYSYPAYDGMDAGGSPWRLSDGDLLAPGLLNVTMRLPAFYRLVEVRPDLELWLQGVPVDARLTEASSTDLARLGDLFAIIDDGRVRGVGGTTLAKVMHRKRPAFVPLHDQYIWGCYVSDDGPVPPSRGRRTWREYIPLLAAAIADDLRREKAWFTDVTGLASGPAITPLRALDIVAWHAGRRARGDDNGDAAEPEEDVGAP